MQKRLTFLEKQQVLLFYRNGLNCTQIARKFGITYQAIRQFLIRRKTVMKDRASLSRKYSLDETMFEIIDNEEKAYFLGLLFADGYIHKKRNSISLSLKSSDLHILLSFQKFLKTNRPIKTIVPNLNCSPQSRLTIQSAKIVSDLEKLGCIQAKSLTLKFPIIPCFLHSHFIRGYFDGDGSVWLNKKFPKLQVYANLMGTETFLNKISEIVPIECKSHLRKMGSIFSLDFSGKSSMIFLNWIYNNATVYLNRKYNRFNAAQNILLFGLNSVGKELAKPKRSRRGGAIMPLVDLRSPIQSLIG